MRPLHTPRARGISSIPVGAIVVLAVFATLACSARQPIVERNDVAITNDVRARLTADARSSSLTIGVDTKEGVVHLTGFVPTDDDRDSVELIARDTAGVRSVDNSVIFGVKPRAPTTPAH